MATNQLDSARAMLLAVAESTPLATSATRAAALVFLGIVEHYRGFDSLARLAFRAALAADSSVDVQGLGDFSPESAQLLREERCRSGLRRIQSLDLSDSAATRFCSELPRVVVAAVERPPELVRGPRIYYPSEHVHARIAGRVLVQAVVDTNGRAIPASIRVTQRLLGAFDKAAVEFVRRARFRPAEVAGRKVKALVVVPLDFTPPAEEVPTVASPGVIIVLPSPPRVP
jgi:TonB family protein